MKKSILSMPRLVALVTLGGGAMDEKQRLNDNFPNNHSSTKRGGNGTTFRVRWVASVFTTCLLIFLIVPRVGWAEENFFQVIVDNTIPVSPDFIKDTGYAVYIRYEGKKFLMDTGSRGSVIGDEPCPDLTNNMKAAAILLDDLDFVFVTHVHSDHTKGLGCIRRERPLLPIYIPPGAGIANFAGGEEFIEVDNHLRVSSNIFIIQTHNDAGTAGVTDELSLLIITQKGPYVFTANSHTGIATILEAAERVAGENIFFLSGGARRRVATKESIRAAAEEITNLGVIQVSPSHSGANEQEIFKEIFGTNYIISRLGQKVPLEPASN